MDDDIYESYAMPSINTGAIRNLELKPPSPAAIQTAIRILLASVEEENRSDKENGSHQLSG